MQRCKRYVWNQEKKQVFGKNATSWLSIFMGSFAVALGLLLFYMLIRQVKMDLQQWTPQMAKLVAEKNRASAALANTSAGNDFSSKQIKPCTSIELPKNVLKKRSLQNFDDFKSVKKNKELVSMDNNSTFLKKIISGIKLAN